MSGQISIPSVFQEPKFWYKIDVDYEEAKELLDNEEDETTDNQETSEGLETIEEALLDLFIRRKKRVIEAKHDTISEFREQVLDDDETARSILTEIYVEYIWIQNQKGEIFETEKDSLNEIGIIVEEEQLVWERINNR